MQEPHSYDLTPQHSQKPRNNAIIATEVGISFFEEIFALVQGINPAIK